MAKKPTDREHTLKKAGVVFNSAGDAVKVYNCVTDAIEWRQIGDAIEWGDCKLNG